MKGPSTGSRRCLMSRWTSSGREVRGSWTAESLGEWLARSGFRFQPLRWFCGADGRVVVEHAGRWHDVATGNPQGERILGSEFVVRAGQVAKYVRHDSG